MTVELRELESADLPLILATDGGPAWHHNPETWSQRLAEQAKGERLNLVAIHDGEVFGYGSILWTSAHLPFREARIPEINNVVVSEPRRNHGVATQIISALEARARATSYRKIGVAIGHFHEYQAAQRLYEHLGYAPNPNEQPSDEDLVLWLVKSLA